MFEKTRTLLAVYRARDPRGLTAADTLFRSPGFHAVLAHRAAHFCALQGWRGLADGIAAFSAQMTGVRIHADARVGENVYLAPGVWLGPDAVVPDGAEVFPEVRRFRRFRAPRATKSVSGGWKGRSPRRSF